MGAPVRGPAILVSVAALIFSRVSRGRRLAERAEASLRLATSLASAPAGVARKLGESDQSEALIAELADDARVNTARYLRSGKGMGIRSPLIALGTVYFFLFVAMGSVGVMNAQSGSERIAGAAIIVFGATSGLVAIFGLINRYSEHRALRAAGLPVVTTWGELKEAGNTVRNLVVVRRLRRQPPTTPAET